MQLGPPSWGSSPGDIWRDISAGACHSIECVLGSQDRALRVGDTLPIPSVGDYICRESTDGDDHANARMDHSL